MKTLKKLLTVIVLCLVAVFGLTACKGKHKNKGDSSSNTTGVYYLYENDTYNKSDYYELLSGNKWKDNDGEKGTYSVSSGTITFYYTFDGETEELFNGTISDGVMCLDIFGEATYYCKDGKTPSGNNGSGGNDGGQTETQHTVTYNANGGAFASGETTLTSKAKDNSTLTAPDSPIRTNYTFAGWAKNSSGSEKWNFSTDKVTGNLTLYATWSQESATILSVDGASIDGLKIFMFVDKDTDSVSLASKVVCSDDSVWKLYYDKLGQTEIPTKIAADISGELLDGDNVFYIVVTSQDGVHVNVYELNVYRSYAIDVCYYDGDNLLKTVTAYTGYEFMPNYTPTITGYTFNDWNYTPEILWDDLELYADKTANTYTVTYDVNGGDELTTTEKTVTYGSSYTFVKPTKTGYTFLGWYYGETQLTDGNGKSLAVWNYAKNLTVKATWERTDLLNFTYMKSTSGITITGVKDKTVTTLIVPEDVIKISAGAFNGCSSLTSITLPFIGGSVSATSASSSTLFGYIFGTSSYTGGTETEQYYDWNGPLDSTYYIPSNLKSVTITGGKLLLGAFYGCNNLTSVTISNGVTSIGEFAFSHCSSLKSVTIPDSVTSIDARAFEDCSSLKIVTIGNGVTNINSNAFADCSGLKGVYITDIAAWCNISFGVTFESNPLYYAENLYLNNVLVTELEIPNTITEIKRYAFYHCDSLTSITIPDSVTSIGDEAFSHCSSLTSITIPDSVTSIGDEAFRNCSGLTDVYYSGTAEDWEKIEIGSDNVPLSDATRYYYSETAPALNADGTAYDGNYWYYNDDNEIVVWIYTKEEKQI